MTLTEVMQAKALMRLEAFRGWRSCGKPTGRWIYGDAKGTGDIKVEISSGFPFFAREWVAIALLQEIKEAMK